MLYKFKYVIKSIQRELKISADSEGEANNLFVELMDPNVVILSSELITPINTPRGSQVYSQYELEAMFQNLMVKGSEGGFVTAFAKAYSLADPMNREILSQAANDLVKKYNLMKRFGVKIE